MKRIPLTRGLQCVVDAEDADWAAQWRWVAHGREPHMYARRSSGGSRRTIHMHREIAARAGCAIDGFVVDHINGNTLDNRRKNLRVATLSENKRNQQRKKDGCTSHTKGVHWHKANRKWIAQIKIEGKVHYLGSFVNEADAQIAYAHAAIAAFGAFAAPFVRKP